MSEDAKWREDFPIQWGADNYVTRREFAKYLTLVSGATVVGTGAFVLRNDTGAHLLTPALVVAEPGELAIGAAKLFRYPTASDAAILVRLSQDEYVAYSQRCTHLQCPVIYQPNERRLACPCHNGAFDVETGAVIQGPPPRPLPRIRLALQNGRVTALGLETPEHG